MPETENTSLQPTLKGDTMAAVAGNMRSLALNFEKLAEYCVRNKIKNVPMSVVNQARPHMRKQAEQISDLLEDCFPGFLEDMRGTDEVETN